MKIQIALLAFVYSIQAFAGFEMQNGEFVSRCDSFGKPGEPKKDYVLELAETPMVKVNSYDNDFEQRQLSQLNRKSNFDLRIYLKINLLDFEGGRFRQTMIKYHRLVSENMHFVQNLQNSTNDYVDFEPFMSGCERPRQAAITRFAPEDPNEPVRVMIDSDIWNGLDEANKTALVLHEVVYLTLRHLNGVKNSISVRKVVSDMMHVDYDGDLPYINDLF